MFVIPPMVKAEVLLAPPNVENGVEKETNEKPKNERENQRGVGTRGVTPTIEG